MGSAALLTTGVSQVRLKFHDPEATALQQRTDAAHHPFLTE
jgi:hypothetical protein